MLPVGEGQDPFSCYNDLRDNSSDCCRWQGVEESHLSLTHVMTTWQKHDQCQLSEGHTLGDSSPTSLPPESALLSCPVEIQGLLSKVLQFMTARDSSLALMTLGPALPPTTGIEKAVDQREEVISPLSMPSQGRGVAGPYFPHSYPEE